MDTTGTVRFAAMITCVLGCAVGLCAAEKPGLVAHYTFEEAAGTVLKDHSGNGHDGQIHNADWVRSAGGRTQVWRRAELC